MDRFAREPYHDGDVVKILSTCVLCGARLLGSRYDESLQAQERRHRATCGRFLHTLSAGGAVVHSTCTQCGLRIHATLDKPIQQIEDTHLQACFKRAAGKSA